MDELTWPAALETSLVPLRTVAAPLLTTPGTAWGVVVAGLAACIFWPCATTLSAAPAAASRIPLATCTAAPLHILKVHVPAGILRRNNLHFFKICVLCLKWERLF